MIVCICKAVSGKDIEELIEKGHQDAQSLSAACGAGTDCGSCRGKIDKMLGQSAGTTRTSEPAQMNEGNE